MHYKGSIRAVNLALQKFNSTLSRDGIGTSAAGLAKARLVGKFEEPNDETVQLRKTEAWERFIDTDAKLPKGVILGPHWAKARLIVHEILSSFTLGDMAFTNGSNFEPVKNRTSVSCKLEDTWTITPDCFDVFARKAYSHRALKLAAKKRFISYCTKHKLNVSRLNRYLWNRFRSSNNPAFEIFCFKLDLTLDYVYGNRWSTVPKNNLKDRSICLEPMCNMLVQRAVGLGVRKCLKDTLGIDLDSLADVHRNRISDQNVATIDLSDCSDTISTWLIRYLLPKRIYNYIRACRSDMTLGPDDNYYIINKVSSMGNGFTFDLMTLILTALTRSFDTTSTVFGDDIICQNQYADDIVSSLRIAGFNVNLLKTNIRSAYRESCGAHYIDGYGYVTAFDFKWLTNPHDIVVTCNKVAILSYIYGEPFESLRSAIWKCVPKTLLGATVARPTVHIGKPPSYELDCYVRYGPVIYNQPSRHTVKVIRSYCKRVCKAGNISVAVAFISKQKVGRSFLQSQDWSLYLQYIFSGRVGLKIPISALKSTLVARVGEEQIGFTKSLYP